MTQQPKETCQRTCRGPISEMIVAHAVWMVNDAWIFRHNANELCLIYVYGTYIHTTMHQETA